MTLVPSAIFRGDIRYPTALAAIPDPPKLLWYRGHVEALCAPSVAIVGSRAASPYALEVARRLSADLARRNIAVVSGMARGVDSAAHLGALDAGGVTIAVFGCGVDIIYPREHRRLADEICERGALVSELAPGVPPLRGHFPRRNRIISGLVLGVVVVEAAKKSGSLITARNALEQGREVLAVPGNVLGGRNEGAHALLRDGAKLVESADDILEELNLGMTDKETVRPDLASHDPVLRCMTIGEPYDLDELASRSGIDRLRLLPRLIELELCGAIRKVDGGRFMRFRASSS